MLFHPNSRFSLLEMLSFFTIKNVEVFVVEITIFPSVLFMEPIKRISLSLDIYAQKEFAPHKPFMNMEVSSLLAPLVKEASDWRTRFPIT